MVDIEIDKDGKRKAPRTPRYGYLPKANIRASYRLGITLIERLESFTFSLSQWHKKGATMWPRFHYRITTSDIARNLIKLGLRKIEEDSETQGISLLELLLKEIISEDYDFEEELRGLGYQQTKKYGAAGAKHLP